MTDFCAICGNPTETVWESSKGELLCEDCFLEEKGSELNKLYRIQDREAGNIIETGLTKEQAEETLKQFEETDEKEDIYTPNFYEIVKESEE